MLAAKRRKIAWLLLALSLLSYFSIPFLTSFFPAVMAAKIGAVSFGLLWGVLQYPLIGLIALCYAVGMRHIDQLANNIKR